MKFNTALILFAMLGFPSGMMCSLWVNKDIGQVGELDLHDKNIPTVRVFPDVTDVTDVSENELQTYEII